MRMRWIRLPLLTAAAVVVSTVLLEWAAAGWADLRALPATPTATPADALADVAAVLGLIAWAWLLLGAILTIADGLTRRPGHLLVRRVAPTAWRRLVLTAVGVGALTAPAAVAQASPGEPPDVVVAVSTGWHDPGSAPDSSVAEAIRGLPLPDRPYGRLAAVGTDDPQRVVVRTGDSLWAIAERHLGPDASTAAIAAEWPRWHAANRALIGPDPDLITPGMVLHAPETKAAS
ncbi:MAG TPA: hypothetical protein VKB55_10665 [Nocardioidaceae bacterium]|nr:hypothetical protein [Nocardioidaceae bacterium]